MRETAIMLATSARLLRLLSLLQSRTAWSGPELAERLGVTTRTVRRDVDRLRDLGYPVHGEPGPEGGYRLEPGSLLPPLLLDDDEATAVVLALRTSAGGSVQGYEEAALAALAKLDRLLPANLRHQVSALRTATVQLGTRAADVDADTLVVLAHACQAQERVRFTYRHRDDRVTDRRVEPFRLVCTGRRWYLVAHDVDRADWRTFRVDRVQDPQPMGHRFTRHDPPDAAAYVADSIAVAPYRYVARVVLDAPRELVASFLPPTVGTLEAIADDATVLTCGADDLDSLAGHLVMLGLSFEVLEPPELREHMVDVAHRIQERHATPGPARPKLEPAAQP
jgi:predicted DNA-binding transcriptional regulator YafY